MYDLIVRNARIADGLGSPLFEGDLAVQDHRIAVVGTVDGEASETVDAEFHNVARFQIFWRIHAEPNAGGGAG